VKGKSGMTKRNCAFCRGEFLPNRVDQVYCKGNCRKRHWEKQRVVVYRRRRELTPQSRQSVKRTRERNREIKAIVGHADIATLQAFRDKHGSIAGLMAESAGG
jgi:hypothetical protein